MSSNPDWYEDSLTKTITEVLDSPEVARGHVWMRDNGFTMKLDPEPVDMFAYEGGGPYCNGPRCVNCNYAYCQHCHSKAKHECPVRKKEA